MNTAVASALVHAAHRLEARLEKSLAAVGLSNAKFEALAVLVTQDRPVSLSEVARNSSTGVSNVTQLIDRLEAERLVKREMIRGVRVKVTALGRKRLAAGTPLVNAVLQDAASKLSAVDFQKLRRALDAVQ